MEKSAIKNKFKRNVIIGTAAMVVIAGAATAVYWNLPNTKLGRKLEEAAAYLSESDYVHAEEAYEEALVIDENSELAYRGLADDYLAQGMQTEAEQILYEGYQETGSEVLLQNYCATVLNDIVEKINADEAGLSCVKRCLDILEEVPADRDAQNLLLTLAERVMGTEETCRMLLEGLDGTAAFAADYEAVMDRIFALAEADSAAFLPALEAYLIPEGQSISLSLSYRDSYYDMLKKAQTLGAAQAQELLACLDKQEEISKHFAPMFDAFEAEEFEAAKEYLLSEEYLAIRDAFIEDRMDYWKSDAYVSVTKEAIVLEREEEGWVFSYLEDDTIAAPTGTIRILAEKMQDLGVQRSSIEFVPAYDPADYYPHTEYEIVYWNTMVSGIATDNTNVVSRMNYRFARKVYDKNGMEANMIYDWGGSNETRKKE